MPYQSTLLWLKFSYKQVHSKLTGISNWYWRLKHKTGLYYMGKQLSFIVRITGHMCGNKMPIRCNRGFYCRSYCLFNMFLAPLCPSSGAQEYYTLVAACGIWPCGFWVVGLVWSWGLCVRFAGCCSMPIIRSPRVLYSGCCLWYLALWFSSCWSGVELKVMCPVFRMLQTGHITLSSTPDQQLENHSTKYHRQQPLYNTL